MTFYLHQNHVIYQGDPGPLPQYIPTLKRINGSYFAVEKTLPNLQALAWYNWPVPPIMTDDNYDWPIEPGKTPLPHQKIMANFAVLHPRAFNLSDPGSMKTVSTLWTKCNPQWSWAWWLFSSGGLVQLHRQKTSVRPL